MFPVCGKCGASGVKIYRSYEAFRRPESDRCNECIHQDMKCWMVPCILNEDGDAFGYVSVPESAYDEFAALPEKSSKHPYWRSVGGWSTD